MLRAAPRFAHRWGPTNCACGAKVVPAPWALLLVAACAAQDDLDIARAELTCHVAASKDTALLHGRTKRLLAERDEALAQAEQRAAQLAEKAEEVRCSLRKAGGWRLGRFMGGMLVAAVCGLEQQAPGAGAMARGLAADVGSLLCGLGGLAAAGCALAPRRQAGAVWRLARPAPHCTAHCASRPLLAIMPLPGCTTPPCVHAGAAAGAGGAGCAAHG